MTSECAALLAKGGFIQIGQWEIDSETGEAFIAGDISKEPGVYAHLLNGRVVYVGSAQRGLRGRMRRYATSKTMRTSQRVREAAAEALRDGAVIEVWAHTPSGVPHWLDGLPIDLVTGLEDGLIKHLRPEWNRRGLGKMK